MWWCLVKPLFGGLDDKHLIFADIKRAQLEGVHGAGKRLIVSFVQVGRQNSAAVLLGEKQLSHLTGLGPARLTASFITTS
jgi:hypothetical protein